MQSVVSLVAARFDRALSKGDDTSSLPTQARLSTAGTEVDWATEDGFARRERTVRVWMSIWSDAEVASQWLDARATHIPILQDATEQAVLLGQKE